MAETVRADIPWVQLTIVGSGVPVLVPAASWAAMITHGNQITVTLMAPATHRTAERKWIRSVDAARELQGVVDGLSLKQAKIRIYRAAENGEFTTNGEHGDARRIDKDSLATWLLRQRENGIDEADLEEDDPAEIERRLAAIRARRRG